MTEPARPTGRRTWLALLAGEVALYLSFTLTVCVAVARGMPDLIFDLGAGFPLLSSFGMLILGAVSGTFLALRIQTYLDIEAEPEEPPVQIPAPKWRRRRRRRSGR
jgi:hypothetical protein